MKGFPGSLDGKASAYNAEDLSSIPGSGRSPGDGSGNPLQYSYLENSMDSRAWQATDHGVTKSRTQIHRLRENQEADCKTEKAASIRYPWKKEIKQPLDQQYKAKSMLM